MSVLDRVRDGLKTRYPDLRYTETNGTIVVHAPVPNGFDVSITQDLIVACDGWHEHFETEEKALACFALGLSDRCRLKVTFRGNFAHKWTFESLKDGQWAGDSTTALLYFPFWRARRIEYRQNSR
ncbi:MAG: hypothetical protein ACREJC_03780 [Tepidisphaeraceae bacterium]